MRAIDSLKIMLAPVLPTSSQRVHDFFGYEEPLFGTQREVTYEEERRSHDALVYEPTPSERAGMDRWRPSELAAGSPFRQPTPLYKLLDPEIIEAERAKLGTDAVEVE